MASVTTEPVDAFLEIPTPAPAEHISGKDLQVEETKLCMHCQKESLSSKEYCGRVCEIKSRFRLGYQLSWPSAVVSEGLGAVCALEGCGLPVLRSRLGRRNAFCSRGHRWISMSPCMKCKSKGSERVFCTPECNNKTPPRGKTLLIELPRSHVLFQQLEQKFSSTWAPPANAPQISHIYQIVMPKPLYNRYIRYRDAEGKGKEELRWHGTIRDCRVGDGGNTTTCKKFRDCNLCSILVHSFDAAKSRYGGVYTASTSAYSSSYSRNNKHSTTKAMLLGAVSHLQSPNILVTSTPRNETLRPAYLLIYNVV